MSSKKQLKKKIIDQDSESESDNEKEDPEQEPEEPIVSIEEGIIDEDDENAENDYDDSDEILSNDEALEGDVKEEVENCYFQYDNLIDEYEELGPPTQVPDDHRITLNKLTKYEMVRVLGIRAQQISDNAPTLVKNIEGKTPVEIAIYELRHKMTPFKIRRPLPNNTYEIWKIKELEINLDENDEKALVNSLN
jgi:DNA-directed RNA polymerase I, II, and III subunit RPABC2